MTMQGIPLWNELKPEPTRPVFILPLDFDNWASSVGVVPLCLPYQRQPHAHPCVLSPPLRNARIMSPFRESVGCQHVNISEMASIKYQALLRGCCWCAGRNAPWWSEWQREREREWYIGGGWCASCRAVKFAKSKIRLCCVVVFAVFSNVSRHVQALSMLFSPSPSLLSSKTWSYFVVQFIELAKPVHTNTDTHTLASHTHKINWIKLMRSEIEELSLSSLCQKLWKEIAFNFGTNLFLIFSSSSASTCLTLASCVCSAGLLCSTLHSLSPSPGTEKFLSGHQIRATPNVVDVAVAVDSTCAIEIAPQS